MVVSWWLLGGLLVPSFRVSGRRRGPRGRGRRGCRVALSLIMVVLEGRCPGPQGPKHLTLVM